MDNKALTLLDPDLGVSFFWWHGMERPTSRVATDFLTGAIDHYLMVFGYLDSTTVLRLKRVCKAWNVSAQALLTEREYVRRATQIVKLLPGESGMTLSVLLAGKPHSLTKLAVAEKVCRHVAQFKAYLLNDAWPVVDVNAFSTNPSLLLSREALAAQPNPTYVILPAGHLMSYYQCDRIHGHPNIVAVGNFNCTCQAGLCIANTRSPQRTCYTLRCMAILCAYTRSLLGYYTITSKQEIGRQEESSMGDINTQIGRDMDQRSVECIAKSEGMPRMAFDLIYNPEILLPQPPTEILLPRSLDGEGVQLRIAGPPRRHPEYPVNLIPHSKRGQRSSARGSIVQMFWASLCFWSKRPQSYDPEERYYQ